MCLTVSLNWVGGDYFNFGTLGRVVVVIFLVGRSDGRGSVGQWTGPTV